MPNEEIKPDSVELDQQILESDNFTEVPLCFICPECGGAMRQTRKGTLVRFQCHIGHAFLVEKLLDSQAEEIEHRLWAMLRLFKERAYLTHRMADEAREQNDPQRVQDFEAQSQQAQQRAELIRQALLLSEVNSPQ